MARSYLGYVSSQTTDTVVATASSIPTVYTFTTTGANNWTVPAGVTYVIANIQAGGGGVRNGSTAAGSGGSSSVAFSAGTQTALGGDPNGSPSSDFKTSNTSHNISPNDYGAGGKRGFYDGATPPAGGVYIVNVQGGRGGFLRVGGAVTEGATLVVTVGAGGTAGSNGVAGQQGIVTLEAYSGNKRRCELFTTSGTFTPPAGVTKVMATIVGGAGGMTTTDGTGTAGSSSSVAFSGGTQTALGGQLVTHYRVGYDAVNYLINAKANTGEATTYLHQSTGGCVFNVWGGFTEGTRGRRIVVSDTVTPSVGVTVTVGLGGNVQGTANAAASGFVNIEYEVP